MKDSSSRRIGSLSIYFFSSISTFSFFLIVMGDEVG
jgi:hypothetical protein